MSELQKSAAWPAFDRGLIAILRGVKPTEIDAIGDALFDAGFRAIEIPLNSPEPFVSIEKMAKRYGTKALIGAGTVLTVEDVGRLHDAGGELLVAPNVDADVLQAAAEKDMVTMPGVFTPTEALAALKYGASGLKFFPASVLGPSGIGAIKAVLPSDCVIGAVGGVAEKHFADYAKIGISAFGLGSSIYKPGMSAAEVAERAENTVAAYDAVFEN